MFLETSALTGENVEEAFLKCARTILNKIESGTAALIWLFQGGEGRVPGGLGGFGSLGQRFWIPAEVLILPLASLPGFFHPTQVNLTRRGWAQGFSTEMPPFASCGSPGEPRRRAGSSAVAKCLCPR